MKLLLAAALLLCTACASVPPPAPPPEVEEINATVLAAYNAISGPAGRRDWDRFEGAPVFNEMARRS